MWVVYCLASALPTCDMPFGGSSVVLFVFEALSLCV